MTESSDCQKTESLKIFADFSLLSESLPLEPILYPFSDSTDWKKIYKRYRIEGRDIFSFSAWEEADVVIIPVNWDGLLGSQKREQAIQLIRRAKAEGKATVSFYNGDCSHLRLPIKSDVIFRQSMFDFTRKPNDFAMPNWSGDILEKYQNKPITIREKSAKPVVGFCGYTNRNQLKVYLKYYALSAWFAIKEISHQKMVPPYSAGHILRAKIISKLLKSSRIETNFIQRKKSFFTPKISHTAKADNQTEFADNLLNSDYALCIRGSGNFSIRLYEALCCGRIPIFVNTHCVLPLDFDIDWRRYCLWVEASELPDLDRKILAFHESLSPEEFIERQHQCRQLWEDYLEPASFFKQLPRYLAASSQKIPDIC